MLVLTQVALRRGIDLNVNMLGRWAVWPMMSALALALVVDSWVLDVAALRRARNDPCGHRPLPARWGAGDAQSLNLYLRKRYSRASATSLERTALDTFPDLGALSDRS